MAVYYEPKSDQTLLAIGTSDTVLTKAAGANAILVAAFDATVYWTYDPAGDTDGEGFPIFTTSDPQLIPVARGTIKMQGEATANLRYMWVFANF